MTTRIAINGFGRIGRMVYRRAIEQGDLEVVAINGTADVESLAHLVRYDSIHGKWDVELSVEDGQFHAGKQRSQVFSTRDVLDLPWAELDIDIVIEATGKFRNRETAKVHLDQGAKRVLITAPAKGESGADLMMVYGVNEGDLKQYHKILSGASCTTNCLAPVVKVLHEAFGVESGMVTTIHSVTNDQRNLDNPHKDLRRARACGQSIIPTSTGAAKAIGQIIPAMLGKLNGLSLRVPTPNVSIIDLVAVLSQDVTREQINAVFALRAETDMRGVLGYTDEPLVSVDFNGDERSSIIDGQSTMVMNNRTVKVLAWYDNEWGYSCRIVDLARYIGDKMTSLTMQSSTTSPSSNVTKGISMASSAVSH